MNILVINCGSSSLKFQLIDSASEKVLAKGLCERIGIDGRLVYQSEGNEKEITKEHMPTHTKAVKLVLEALVNPKTGAISSLDEIGAVGHRIVHGGEAFTESTLITDEVIAAVERVSELAPLHNPANLIGIEACQKLMPGVPMAAVFDTAFHQTMPAEAYMYGIPYKYYSQFKVRKYGFHGTSHSYVSKHAADMLGQPYESLKTIVCHLGNGASVCAVKNGKSVDTSMGLTPLEGLVMGTRSGDIDPSVIEYIAEKENFEMEHIMDVLNKKSGVYGISGVSSDFRDIEAAAEAGDERAALAQDVFCYRVVKYIGAYAAAMNGVDAICFTAGLGENSGETRKKICDYLGYLGVELDEEANKRRGEDLVISTESSKVKVLMVPTNEELAIARETAAGKKEFLEKGFQKASMRSIASSLAVTTGAIYRYYTDKEAIFEALVEEPAKELADRYRASQQKFAEMSLKEQLEGLPDVADHEYVWMVDYVYDHFDAFKLIACCSTGTRYEHYLDALIEIEVNASHLLMEKMQREGLNVLPLDDDMVHILASALFNGLFETVRHDTPKEKAVAYVDTLRTFYSAGWFKILGIQ